MHEYKVAFTSVDGREIAKRVIGSSVELSAGECIRYHSVMYMLIRMQGELVAVPMNDPVDVEDAEELKNPCARCGGEMGFNYEYAYCVYCREHVL